METKTAVHSDPILFVIGMIGSGLNVQTVQAAGTTGASQTNAGEMKVHFLDVGQGLSILVQSEGKTMIYDGGDKKTSSFVVAYLKDQGVYKDRLPDQQPLRCRSYGRTDRMSECI